MAHFVHRRRHTWRCFRYATIRETAHSLLVCTLMAVFFLAHIHLYGWSVAYMGHGDVGAALAWCVIFCAA